MKPPFPPGAMLRLSVALACCLFAGAQAQTPNPNLGRSLAATCANCHGTNGNAKADMKPLSGVPADRIVKMFTEFRSGEQPASIMHQISKGYTDDQLKLIAAYFAAQKPAN